MGTSGRLEKNALVDVLSSYKNAIAIYTTEDIIIEMATGAMLEFWGRDASVIGLPLDKALPEISNQPFVGMLKNVLKTGIDDIGKAIRADLIVDGKLQTFYFDYEYRAIKNEKGETYCVLHTAEDVTDLVFASAAMEKARIQEAALHSEQRLNEELAAANEELAATNEELSQAQESLRDLNTVLEERVLERTAELTASEARLRYLIADAPVAIAVVTGRELIIEAANKKMLEAWSKTKDIIGRPLHLALPELIGQEFLDLLDAVYTSGFPYHGNEVKALIENNGIIEEVYSNFVYHPLKDEEGNTTSIMLIANIVTEQVKARKMVEENERRFGFMLDTIPQQVWTSRPDGKLDYVNQVVCNDFGFNVAEIVELGWQKFIHPADLSEALKKWQQSLNTGKEYQAEFRLLFKDGSYKWHLARALPLIEEGSIKSWFGTNTNIELQKDNEQRKDEFLSIASHELKTPLTSIKAFNQLMTRTTDAAKLESFVVRSAGHIMRLERLISDLLDVTKINAGKMNYAMEPFDFRKMLQDSVETVQQTAPEHQIILEAAPELIYNGDHFRLEQVMNNFLTNAVKYSPKGNKILVNCKVELSNVVVSVQDFGIGIAPANLDKLFDRYYRVDNTVMRFEGLGLGLYISSEILKRHNGSFWLESEEGKGSTFYFRLPLQDNEIRPVMKTESYYQDNYIAIFYNREHKRINLDWTGFQTLESVKHGYLTALEIIVRHNCAKVVNNNRHVLGTWSEASDWTGETFFPLMEKAGVKYLAWVFSSSMFSQLSARKAINVFTGDIKTQFFTDMELAESWIDGK